jgi:(5-formylfuran-3-yl)methyl phosphate synthase
MQLLVSVRSAAEVEPALAGGADIIDAKEPDRGSLGPVSAQTLAEILVCLPSNRTFSVALGDVAIDADVVAAITSLRLPSRPAPTFLKLGFAGVRSPELAKRLLTTAVEVAAGRRSAPLIVAVAYADAGRAETLPPEVVCRLAHQAGAAGVLLDTYIKDGVGLLRWLDPPRLAQWIADARQVGLLTAVAGGLELDDVELVTRAGPDVFGVRGAACECGRGGQICPKRVRELRQRLGQRPSGETRDQAADRVMARGAKSLKNKA